MFNILATHPFISPPNSNALNRAAKDVTPATGPLHNVSKNEGVFKPVIPLKSAIGTSADKEEEEANTLADSIMRMPEQYFVQRKCNACEEGENMQPRPLSGYIQRKEFSSVPAAINDKINAGKDSGSSIDRSTQTFMQSRFGTDFGHVKIHTGDEATQMNRELHSKAFTIGSDIYFNQGQYNPGSNDGKHLLAHELTHTIQQKSNTILKVPDKTTVPEIENPADINEWKSPGGEQFQWQNKALLETSFPERANGLRSLLLLVKELELRGYLGTVTVARKEINAHLAKYLEELNGLNDEELAQLVTSRFELYKDTTAFPEWMKEVVMDYSGMKYKSAHGSYFNPVKLLEIIKTNELYSADINDRDLMISEAAEMTQDGTSLDIVDLRERRELKKTFSDSSLETLKKGIPAKEKVLFNELMQKENALWSLYLDLQKNAPGSQEFTDNQAAIIQKEEVVAAMETSFKKATWQKIKRKRAAKKEALLKIYRAVALAKVRKLNDAQALELISVMHQQGQIPEEAWKEIVGHTELRLQITSADQMEPERKALKGVLRDPLISEEVWARWKYFLKKWYEKDATGWRAKHRETLSANVVATLVCDQLASVIQNLRKISAPGGLRKNALAYYEAAQADWGGDAQSQEPVKTAFPKGPTSPFFKKPKSISDFPVGASIFFTKWSELAITDEYKRLYKKQQDVKGRIDYRQSQINMLTKNKNRKSWEEANLTKYVTEVEALKTERESLSEQQAGMDIYLPEKDKTPDNSNLVPFMEGSERELTIGGKPITQCMTEGEWTYAFYERIVTKTETIRPLMRAMPNKFDGKDTIMCPDDFKEGADPLFVKQWLKWQHEATVMFVIPETGIVVTFDTSFSLDAGKNARHVNALGTRKRHLTSLLNAENLYVGFVPEKIP